MILRLEESMRNGVGVLAILACTAVGMAQSPQTVGGHIFVVRHAEKITETADELSAQGKARAACLATTLKDSKVDAVIVSPTNRALQTGEPTASEFKVQTKSVKADDYVAIASAAKDAAKNGDVLIVGHSNTVPLIVKAIGNVDVAVGNSEYDKLFVIDSAGVAQLHYCPTAGPEPESRMK
jgi:broad specificity phosphatase PhoE